MSRSPGHKSFTGRPRLELLVKRRRALLALAGLPAAALTCRSRAARADASAAGSGGQELRLEMEGLPSRIVKSAVEIQLRDPPLPKGGRPFPRPFVVRLELPMTPDSALGAWFDLADSDWISSRRQVDLVLHDSAGVVAWWRCVHAWPRSYQVVTGIDGQAVEVLELVAEDLVRLPI